MTELALDHVQGNTLARQFDRAAELAEHHTISVYDAAYVIATGEAGRRLISCDERDLVSKALLSSNARRHGRRSQATV